MQCCQMSQKSLELESTMENNLTIKQSFEKKHLLESELALSSCCLSDFESQQARLDWGKLKCQGVVLYVDEGKREGCLHVCRDESSIHRASVTHTHS